MVVYVLPKKFSKVWWWRLHTYSQDPKSIVYMRRGLNNGEEDNKKQDAL